MSPGFLLEWIIHPLQKEELISEEKRLGAPEMPQWAGEEYRQDNG